MLSFRHGTETVSLQPGGTWATAARTGSYRDTAAETLRAIIAEIEQGRPWREAVAARYADTQPWLHQVVTSPARPLFFQQHPPPAGSTVLDIGAGWGQIALPLAREHGAQVTALEPTPERLAFIRAAAAQERLTGHMRFIQADFFDLEFDPVFDLVCCIGVLEWVPKFRAGDPHRAQLEFLRRIRAALRPGGSCCVGIENRLGLKYLLGARDDHLAEPGVAVYDAALAASKWQQRTGGPLRTFTFTSRELAGLLTESGFNRLQFFAALPDYKIPHLILPLGTETNAHFGSNAHIPEHDGIDGSPLPFQAELRSHYHTLAQLQIAHEFAPSFYVVAHTD